MTGIFFRVEFNLPKTASGRFKIHKMEAEMCAFTTSSFLRILISNAHRTETGGAATWKFKGSCKFKDTSEHKPPSADMCARKNFLPTWISLDAFHLRPTLPFKICIATQSANLQVFRNRIYPANVCQIFDAIPQKNMMFNLIVLRAQNIDDHFIIDSLRNIRISVALSKSNFTKTGTFVDNTYEQ